MYMYIQESTKQETCTIAGQEIAGQFPTILIKCPTTWAYITYMYTIHYMSDQKSLMCKRILDFISCSAIVHVYLNDCYMCEQAAFFLLVYRVQACIVFTCACTCVHVTRLSPPEWCNFLNYMYMYVHACNTEQVLHCMVIFMACRIFSVIAFHRIHVHVYTMYMYIACSTCTLYIQFFPCIPHRWIF